MELVGEGLLSTGLPRLVLKALTSPPTKPPPLYFQTIIYSISRVYWYGANYYKGDNQKQYYLLNDTIEVYKVGR